MEVVSGQIEKGQMAGYLLVPHDRVSERYGGGYSIYVSAWPLLSEYPGDGTVVTDYWYRCADQPALLNADLTADERERLQQRVEKLHRHWKKDGRYLPPPKFGVLADVDPALIVTPPSGLEVGHVPLATRQAAVQ